MASKMSPIEEKIFNESKFKFMDLTKEIYQFQYANNQIYQKWVTLTHPVDKPIQNFADFPFLPISQFKNSEVHCDITPEIVFTSSSTTGVGISKHFVHKIELYENSFIEGFNAFYNDFSEYKIFALLPNYLERQGSSLVYMAEYMIKNSNLGGGFYLYDFEKLLNDVQLSLKNNEPVLLLGVTFALLDFAEFAKNIDLKDCIIMETGGMKGRGPELTRTEIHQILNQAFQTKNIHSEYGMTELLSQAYSKGNGRFQCPPWMKIFIQDPTDPQNWLPNGKTGRICIIDLANLYSCSFIATDDLGKIHEDGSFEIMGRIDFSDIRGCSLLTV